MQENYDFANNTNFTDDFSILNRFYDRDIKDL